MINLLDDYIWRSLPMQSNFHTNHNLCKKVDIKGQILPFYGNTIVFDLDEATKKSLQSLQEELYRKAGWMLAQKLDSETFHMTLHDLVNAPELTVALQYRMQEAEVKAKAILESWKEQPSLRMKATWLFNMVNTSIVLGLAPSDEASWYRLDEMYTELDSVVHLGYALTPHITMAYFKPGNYTQYDLNYLRQVLHPVNLDVELSFENLFYQEFSDMNHYRTK